MLEHANDQSSGSRIQAGPSAHNDSHSGSCTIRNILVRDANIDKQSLDDIAGITEPGPLYNYVRFWPAEPNEPHHVAEERRCARNYDLVAVCA